MARTYEVPALTRAAGILQALSTTCSPVKTSVLLKETGMSRSTLYLLLESLQHIGWIERRRDGYVIGVALFELGSAYVRQDSLMDTFRAEAARFIGIHNEVVQMAVLDGLDVIYLAREDAHQPVRLVSDLGMRLPAHGCALGKALLASLPPGEAAALLPSELRALTAHTITSLPALLADLDAVRRNGIATDREEVCEGLHCFAAYVGQTRAGRRLAISTSIPMGRLSEQRERKIAVDIIHMAQKIAAHLGK